MLEKLLPGNELFKENITERRFWRGHSIYKEFLISPWCEPHQKTDPKNLQTKTLLTVGEPYRIRAEKPIRKLNY